MCGIARDVVDFLIDIKNYSVKLLAILMIAIYLLRLPIPFNSCFFLCSFLNDLNVDRKSTLNVAHAALHFTEKKMALLRILQLILP